MLYTKTLLSRYLTLSTDPTEYAQLLTDRVCEVEEIHTRVIPEEVVIGYVLSVEKHPDADKLVVCQLDCGSLGHFQICTGATNIASGQYVAVAVPGCHLPAIDLQIAPRQMRGLDSNGMICSLSELGIDLDSGQHWIWVIQGDGLRTDPGKATSPTAGAIDTLTTKDCGKPLREAFPRLEGRIIDVENKTITHRPDMFGHLGLAIESRTMLPDDVNYSRLPAITDQMNQGPIIETLTHSKPSDRTISIQHPACRSYALISYADISVGVSDLYTKVALLDIDQLTTNTWVDFSNLFMHTTGQPIHCFDADKVSGSITIRAANDGEEFVDLFDTTHTLTSEDLVITDDEGVIALAGIVGGKDSGVSETTTNILIECANFDPVMIRKTALRVGLRTDAQIRYEKDINPLYTLACVGLLQDELAYYQPTLGSYTFAGLQRDLSAGDTPLTSRISYDPIKIWSQVMGTAYDDAAQVTIQQIFTGLGFTIGESSLQTPVRRGPDDLTSQHDLIEEVARMIGYNTIPERELSFPIRTTPLSPQKKLIKDVESLLADTYRLDGIQTYSWTHKQRLPYEDTSSAYTIANPIDADRTTMRSTMLRGLIEAVTKNQGTFSTQRIFDLGRTRDQSGAEHVMAGVMLVVPTTDDRQTHPQHTLQALQSEIVALANARGKLETTKTTHDYAHPLQQATLTLNRQPYGRILTLHPGFVEKHGLDAGSTYVFAEVSLTTLLAMRSPKKKKKSFASLQDHQIRRDVAFVIPRDADYGSITDAVSKVREVQEIHVFDLYAGSGLPEDKKSIGLRYMTTYSETPTSDQINELLEKVITAGKKAGGEVRGK